MLEPRVRKIIVIDDNELIHEDFKKILVMGNEADVSGEIANEILGKASGEGLANFKGNYYLEFASQGRDGFEKIKSAAEENSPFQVAFVDMRMPPGWDGLETIDNIFMVDDRIQIVICSAYSDYSWDEIVKKVGSSDRLLILKKPFDNIEIIQLASNLCEKWELGEKASVKMTELESVIKERTEKVRLMERQLYQASKLAAIGELSGVVAHELKNPLTVIQAYIERIEDIEYNDDKVKEVIRECIEGANRNISRMVSIIDHLKTFGRENKGEVSKVSLHKVIESSFVLFGKQFKNQNIEIVKNYYSMGNIFIMCDPDQIEQVFINLFVNAQGAMENLPMKAIEITTDVEDGKAIIYFEDTGPGIGEEIEDKIFNPFFTTKDTGRGTGLGLSIVHGIVKDHRGDIESIRGDRGAKFKISFPLA